MTICENKNGIELQNAIKLEENHWELAMIDIIMYLAMESNALCGIYF